MNIDYSALESFFSFLSGELALDEVLCHPAYQVIFSHALRYGDGLTQDDVEQALAGQPSPFYGLENLRPNLVRIQQVVSVLRLKEMEWCADTLHEFERLLPKENLTGLQVFPVLGYDQGIGLGNAVCLNLNHAAYLREPQEFLYYMIHEIAHILYERNHKIPPLHKISTTEQWRDYFALWVQNEGFAVYSALRLRVKNADLNDRDYQVLMDPAAFETCLHQFFETVQLLYSLSPLSLEDLAERIFGENRVTYRIGCEIFRRIESNWGLRMMRQAFSMDGVDFLKRFGPLLE